MASFIKQLGAGFGKIQRAELIDTVTSELAGIFAGDQSIAGVLDKKQELPHLSYPIDLHRERENGVLEYENRIQFTAKSYRTKKTTQKTGTPIEIGDTVTEITSVISLYHPNQLTTSYNNEWGTEELGVAGAVLRENPNIFDSLLTGDMDDMGGPISNFIGAAGDKLAKKLVQQAGQQSGLNVLGAASKSLGVAQNPRLAMLFKGVTPRTFNFAFQFAPRSEEEVLQVIAILKAFRYYSAPGFSNRSENQSYFSYPEVFDIKLFHGSEENTTLFPYSTSACTGIEMDFSPQAVWATFDNGFPVVVNLNLSFTELDIITKNTIEKEFK